MNELIEIYERCTGMDVPPRQPYAGELVFTAFSGSHQDAIKKGLSGWQKSQRPGDSAAQMATWDVPYLTIDPYDIGRHYREVIRVNSQSGKGGVAYLLESEFGIILPKEMQREFGPLANEEVDRLGREVTATELRDIFWREYIERTRPWRLESFRTEGNHGAMRCRAQLFENETARIIEGEGNGPIAAFAHGLKTAGVPDFEVCSYSEHALGTGADATAIAYFQIRITADKRPIWGAAVDTDIELASIKAVLSALNRAVSKPDGNLAKTD
jgi:2-isopropylmalate synthase